MLDFLLFFVVLARRYIEKTGLILVEINRFIDMHYVLGRFGLAIICCQPETLVVLFDMNVALDRGYAFSLMGN